MSNGAPDQPTRPRVIDVDGLSLVPLMLYPLRDETVLASATGFVVQREQTSFLITNRHVLVGSADVGIPNKLGTRLRVMASEFCKDVSFNLINEESNQQWFEHPEHGSEADVVALPIPSYRNDLAPKPLDLNLAKTDMSLLPTEQVSVIGYPFGQSSGALLPIWVSGSLASDFTIDWRGNPAFLISGTTKPSMSGSPVIARRIGTVRRTSGTHTMNGRVNDKFLGVYSGRLIVGEEHVDNDGLDSHIGIVWRAHLITEIIDHAMERLRENSDPRLNPRQE